MQRGTVTLESRLHELIAELRMKNSAEWLTLKFLQKLSISFFPSFLLFNSSMVASEA